MFLSLPKPLPQLAYNAFYKTLYKASFSLLIKHKNFINFLFKIYIRGQLNHMAFASWKLLQFRHSSSALQTNSNFEFQDIAPFCAGSKFHYAFLLFQLATFENRMRYFQCATFFHFLLQFFIPIPVNFTILGIAATQPSPHGLKPMGQNFAIFLRILINPSIFFFRKSFM